MYCSNLSFKFSRQTQKKLVGILHYGHFSKSCKGPAKVLQRSCKGPAKVLQRSCKGPAKVLQMSCKCPAKILQRSCLVFSVLFSNFASHSYICKKIAFLRLACQKRWRQNRFATSQGTFKTKGLVNLILTGHIMLRDMLTQNCACKKTVTDFG
jgi:hypothetical protein